MKYLTKNSIDNQISIKKQSSQADLWARNSSKEVQIFTEILWRDYSENTKRAITRDLKEFYAWYWIKNNETFSFSRLVNMDIVDFKVELIQKWQKPASINRKLSSIKILCLEAVSQWVAREDLMKGIKSMKKTELAPKAINEQEERRFIKEVVLWNNKRDLALISLMIEAWLRVSEVIKLEIWDVFITDRKWHLIIRNWKGWKTREVPLNKELRALLDEYIKEQTQEGIIFRGQRWWMTQSWVDKIVRKYWSKIKLDLSSHILRHTYATKYLRNHPWDIVSLAKILWHSNINTTAIYTQESLESLQDKIELD